MENDVTENVYKQLGYILGDEMLYDILDKNREVLRGDSSDMLLEFFCQLYEIFQRRLEH